MNLYKFSILIVILVVSWSCLTEAKKKHKHKYDYPSGKSKIKTKWSSSAEVGPNGANAMVATEEHGYYVKRTYQPLNETITGMGGNAIRRQSPPYLAIPIAWFNCEGEACLKTSSVAINGQANAANDGFLCEDDCVEPYEPICGKTPSEVAVFYNKCKLNVAKCRTHGLWQDFAYEECKQTYPKEVECAERKFKTSPFFVSSKDVAALESLDKEKGKEDNTEEESILEAAIEALNEIGDKLVAVNDDNDTENDTESDSESESDDDVDNKKPGISTPAIIPPTTDAKLEKVEKPEKSEKSEKPEKSEMLEKPEKQEQPEKSPINTKLPTEGEKKLDKDMTTEVKKGDEKVKPTEAIKSKENETAKVKPVEKVPEKMV